MKFHYSAIKTPSKSVLGGEFISSKKVMQNDILAELSIII